MTTEAKKKRREELLKFFQDAEKDLPAESGMMAMPLRYTCEYCGKTEDEIFGDGPVDLTKHTEECIKGKK